MISLLPRHNLNQNAHGILYGYISLAVIYVIFFGSLLFLANGMPYVTDNNETYSTIIHAKSLSQFGISKTHGLADELFSQDGMAHPFVHSHQGNYPRLFAWLIYELGAKTPSEQILVTTFTVGLAGILLAFAFLSRISNALFAFVCCLMFISDYVFFSQWQVVTYRVWYTFVFFLQFLSIERFTGSKNILWLLIVVINTALFCYGELIFAAFLGLFSFFWLMLRGWPNWRCLLFGSGGLLVGLTLAISTLVAQGIAYLGADAFMKDVLFTFTARNNFESGRLALAEISNFYREHNVVFWENMMGRDQFIGAKPFIQSIFSSFIDVYSPIAAIFFGILLFGYTISSRFQKFYEGTNKRLMSFQSRSDTLVFSQQYSIVSLAIIYLMMIGTEIAINYYDFYLSSWLFPIFALEVVALTGIIVAFGGRTVLFFILLTLCTVALSILLPYVANKNLIPYWIAIHGAQIVSGMIWLLPMFNAVCAVTFSWQDQSKEICWTLAENQFRVPNVIQFILIGLFAYAIIYFLSPGYIFSGYVVRYAPFLVFIFNIALSVGFYILIQLIKPRLFLTSSSLREKFDLPIIICSSILLFFITALWIGLQYSLIQRLPPTHLNVLEMLSASTYKGASFIVNTYAAPVAVQTGGWAYMDPNIEKALLIKVDGGHRLLGDRRYLWFADKNNNDEYRRPDYFICMLGQDVSTVLSQIQSKGSSRVRGCLSTPLAKLAVNSKYSNQELRLIDFDETGVQRTGVASWAIIKFDWGGRLGNGLVWEVPPSLEPSK